MNLTLADLIDLGLLIGSVGGYLLAYGAVLLLTRPARPPAAAATPDLGDEPPAVVNLLANRWRLNEDAGESTLLDLAARRLIELRQPDNDPFHTTVHLPAEPPDESALRPYERRVMDWIRAQAVNGTVPVTALTFRNPARAKQWSRWLHHEIVADARARGLSRRRVGPAAITALTVVAALAALGVAIAVTRIDFRGDEGGGFGGLGAGVIAFFVFMGIAARSIGERDTPAGRAVAARWLGVRAWLRGHEEFADLPPAAVAIWDRYLGYGAALGVTHTASAVLDLGMGDRRLVWSSYGGHWRRVRVRYPKVGRRYGLPVPRLLLRAAGAAGFGGAFLWLYSATVDLRTGALADLGQLSSVPLWLGVAGLGVAGYRLLGTLIDLGSPRTVTGEVLWVEVWRSTSGGENQPSVPWLDYLAIDDGTADRTVAWGLPRSLRASCQEHDTVTVQVRPWSRRVVSLTVVKPGRRPIDSPAEEPSGYQPAGHPLLGALGREARARRAAGTAGGAPAGGRTPVQHLLTPDEVGTALGLAARLPSVVPAGPLPTAVFEAAGRPGGALLMVNLVDAQANAWWVRRWLPRPPPGTPVLPIGDGGYQFAEHGLVTVGQLTVVLTLLEDAKDRREHLPWLLTRAAGRLPAAPPAAGPAELTDAGT